MRNVTTWLKAIEQGYEPKMYPYAIEQVPAGEYRAVLDCKVWAKKIMGICCYFTQEGTGCKFQLTVYRQQGNGMYKIKDCDIGFTDCPVGRAYQIKVSHHPKERAVFESAVLV